ncbi:MAG: hypothetical protein ABFC38_06775 [Methanospirillum sp.]
MSRLEIDPQGMEPGAGGRPTGTKTVAGHRTRGGTSYQHSLSARGIKSSGRERSRSDEDLLSSLDRLDRATRRPPNEDDETEGRRRTRAYGRHGGERERREGSDDGVEQRVRPPRLEW